jgi:hypothetical protein
MNTRETALYSNPYPTKEKHMRISALKLLVVIVMFLATGSIHSQSLQHFDGGPMPSCDTCPPLPVPK